MFDPFGLQASAQAQHSYHLAQDLAGLIRNHAQSAVVKDPDATLALLRDTLAALKAILSQPAQGGSR